jgi:hypothetical protein
MPLTDWHLLQPFFRSLRLLSKRHWRGKRRNARCRVRTCDFLRVKQVISKRISNVISHIRMSMPPILCQFHTRFWRLASRAGKVWEGNCSAEIALETPPPVYSHLPNIAQTAGIVVTSPTVARVAPTAFRCSALSRSAKSRAMPAPSITRVTMMNASSGRVSWIFFTIAKLVVFLGDKQGEGCRPCIPVRNPL